MCEQELQAVKVEDALLEQPESRADSHRITCHDICKDPDHRKLAICSIICGLSCLGIMSLMYSVKARETRKRLQNENTQETQQMVQNYSEKACKWGIGSIVAWVGLILIFPLLLGFLSYVVTFID
ncbi:Transmembrane protein 265 [Labeo rohita]|uniref:Transmembrane protein 265 n=1 Tax=Labeo rohita TaxID=84645 RepID=A0ABQ8MTU6_LABRO|nr:Transmembrane protein 265 [Labeo rohita]